MISDWDSFASAELLNYNLTKLMKTNLKQICRISLLSLSSLACVSCAPDSSISNSEIASCQDYLLGVDILDSLLASSGTVENATNEQLRALVLDIILLPTSQRITNWNNVLGKQYLNLERFGTPENKELSKLVFATKRNYVKGLATFSTSNEVDKVIDAVNGYLLLARQLQKFCEENIS